MSFKSLVDRRASIKGVCCFLTPRSLYAHPLTREYSAESAIEWLSQRLDIMGFADPFSKWNAVKAFRIGGKINGWGGWVGTLLGNEWDVFVKSLGGRRFRSSEEARNVLREALPSYDWRGVPPEILIEGADEGADEGALDIYANLLDERLWERFLSPRLDIVRRGFPKGVPKAYEFQDGFRPSGGVHVVDLVNGLDGITEKNTVNRKWGVLVEYLAHDDMVDSP